MAAIRQRNGRWEVRVRRKGYPCQSESFKDFVDAQKWGRMIEAEMDRGVFVARGEAETTTLKELLLRYKSEVTSTKKHSDIEGYRVDAWIKHKISSRIIGTLRSTDIAKWRDERVKQGAGANTIRLELAIISHLFNVARSEWGFESLNNITENVRKPKLPRGRERRVTDAEIALIKANTESEWLPHIIDIALYTAMRRGEIASLERKYIDLTKNTLKLPNTKNGDARSVPLSSQCVAIFKALSTVRHFSGRVFNTSDRAITRAFIRACERAGIEGLHFHDLRHEAVTRLFEKGLNVAEVSAISGHRSLQMLKRYTHLKAEDLALKLG